MHHPPRIRHVFAQLLYVPVVITNRYLFPRAHLQVYDSIIRLIRPAIDVVSDHHKALLIFHKRAFLVHSKGYSLTNLAHLHLFHAYT
ncbi:hypothetical protein D3C81_940530 [compost metagenome]